MGGIAARMHHVAEELSGVRSFDRSSWDAEGLIGSAALWGDALTVPGLDEDARQQLARTREAVSYTHLDVYKRQVQNQSSVTAPPVSSGTTTMPAKKPMVPSAPATNAL